MTCCDAYIKILYYYVEQQKSKQNFGIKALELTNHKM